MYANMSLIFGLMGFFFVLFAISIGLCGYLRRKRRGPVYTTQVIATRVDPNQPVGYPQQPSQINPNQPVGYQQQPPQIISMQVPQAPFNGPIIQNYPPPAAPPSYNQVVTNPYQTQPAYNPNYPKN